MDDTKVKGLAFLHINEFVESQFGEGGLSRVAAKLPPEVRRSFETPHAFDWYPLTHHAVIEQAVCDELYGGDYSKAALLGRYDAMAQIGKVYRGILNFMNPAFLIKCAPKLFSLTMSQGKCEVEMMGRDMVLRLSGWEQPHKVICYDWLGTIEGALEVCGVACSKVVHSECRLEGAPACVYVAKLSSPA